MVGNKVIQQAFHQLRDVASWKHGAKTSDTKWIRSLWHINKHDKHATTVRRKDDAQRDRPFTAWWAMCWTKTTYRGKVRRWNAILKHAASFQEIRWHEHLYTRHTKMHRRSMDQGTTASQPEAFIHPYQYVQASFVTHTNCRQPLRLEPCHDWLPTTQLSSKIHQLTL